MCLGENSDADDFSSTEDEASDAAPAGKLAKMVKRSQKAKKKMEKEEAKNDPPLSLGTILRALDGGSECPGRMMVMTTNREEMLDAAFKRPGRVKKIRMENLMYEEFKSMILHFLPHQEHLGERLPTRELWTQQFDELAQSAMEDFQDLQAMRNGDLDLRGLGLSPAMLEDCCINSESLEELFSLLMKELVSQWGKASLDGEPTSMTAYRNWSWHMHSLRTAVLFQLQGSAYLAALNEWPEQVIRHEEVDLDMEGGDAVGFNGTIPSLVHAMLLDEANLNESLEICKSDYSHKPEFEVLRYASEIWLVGRPLFGENFQSLEEKTLEEALGCLLGQIQEKWALALETRDAQLEELLQNQSPPSLGNYITMFPKSALAQGASSSSAVPMQSF